MIFHCILWGKKTVVLDVVIMVVKLLVLHVKKNICNWQGTYYCYYSSCVDAVLFMISCSFFITIIMLSFCFFHFGSSILVHEMIIM